MDATVVGDATLFAELEGELRTAAAEARELAEFRRCGDTDLYLKASALRGKARVRHGLRALFLRSPLPRLREYENLAWLRAHGFEAAEPLLAGRFDQAGWPRYQFLATRRRTDAAPWTEAWEAAPPEARDRFLRALLTDVARMHDLGFVHRDLFLRNLLVADALGPAPRIVFLDAWRGGARSQLRGPTYDLACLTLDLAGSEGGVDEEELRAHYEAARRAGWTSDPARFWKRVAHEREHRARRRAP